jgi:RNA polymerase sigma factor (sigma-70 family)
MSAFTAQLARYISIASTQRTDGELLAGFLDRNEEADFAELVRRHGPMVWGTCRRALPDKADAEDAFQTVFLVLIQRGIRLVSSPSIGPWLHRVAVWTTRNVRRRNARQLAKRETLSEEVICAAGHVDLALDIDAALLSLPEKFRSSIVLCHLLGYSRADAAAQLGCAERTLSSWLARGLAQLRERLRGLDPAKALGIAAVAVPLGLTESVVNAAISLRTAAVAASVLSPTVSQLVEGVIRMFWVKKATAVTVAMFTMFAFGVGVGVTTHQLSPAVGGDVPLATALPLPDNAAAADRDADPNVGFQTMVELQTKIDEITANLRRIEVIIDLTTKQLADVKAAGLDKKANESDSLTIQLMNDKLKTALSEKNHYIAELDGLQKTKQKLLERLKALPQKPQPQLTQTVKNPIAPPQDIDKQLEDLKTKLAMMQIETQRAQVEYAARIAAQKKALEDLNAAIARLQREKEKAKEKTDPAAPADKTKSGYLEVTLDIKLGGPGQGLGAAPSTFPYMVKEVGSDGKVVGLVYFTNADVFGRYLTRTLKDSSGPKELRIDIRADAPAEQLKLAMEVCKAAGFKDIVVTKTYLAEKLNEAITEAKLKEDRLLYAQEIQRAYEARQLQLEVQKRLEIQKQQEKVVQDVQDALKQKQVELQKLLEQKEEEIRKLKEAIKLPKKGEPADPKRP